VALALVPPLEVLRRPHLRQVLRLLVSLAWLAPAASHGRARYSADLPRQPAGASVSSAPREAAARDHEMTSTILAVDPVPWARGQMAFTLAFHIILVPLGVSWAFLTLIANYRAIRHDDADALLLAQRWSKYMAVTFAVGAVTGTVLTFEFGLLWPRFM